MNRIIQLFVYLTLLLILLEMSFMGLLFTQSFLYLAAICIVTMGISLVGYGLYLFSNTNKTKTYQDQYHFYIDTNFYEDKLYNRINKRL